MVGGMVAEPMWWVGWLQSLCGGWCGEIEIKANLSSSQSCELKLELSLAICAINIPRVAIADGAIIELQFRQLIFSLKILNF